MILRSNHSPFVFFGLFSKTSGGRTRDSYGTERGEDTVAALFPRKGLRPFPWKGRDSPVADLLLCSCFAIRIDVMSHPLCSLNEFSDLFYVISPTHESHELCNKCR